LNHEGHKGHEGIEANRLDFSFDFGVLLRLRRFKDFVPFVVQ
jgi:hypothetical protein